MDFWTFIIILVLIGVFKEVALKKYQRPHSDKKAKFVEQEINELKRRIYYLEYHPDIKSIEKRLQAIETIVVDSDYQLDMRFRRELKK